METKQMIADGKTALGIEFGSTRIKVVHIRRHLEWTTRQLPKLGKRRERKI